MAGRVFISRTHRFRRAVATALLAVFALQDLGLAEVIPVPAQFAREAFSRGLAQTVLPKLPPSVARVEETYFPDESSRALILVQDAHTNRTGQMNVARTLDFLLAERAVRTIFLEGGEGDESLSVLRKYASPAERRRFADSYVRKGQLQGTEYLDLTSEHELVLWGVEDMRLYGRSLEAYRSAHEARGRAEEYLARAESAVRALEPRVYNPFLFEFERKFRDFRDGRAAITDYMDALTREAAKLNIPLSSYPHLKTFNKLRELEAGIDFEKANEEQALAVAESGAAEELAEASKDARSPFRLGAETRDPRRAFYLLLEARLGEGLSRYPALGRYLEYLRYAADLDAPGLLEEQERLESAVFTALCESRDEALLLECSRNIDTLKSLLRLSLLPDEYRRYRRARRAHGLARMTGFLNRKLMESGGSYEKAIFLESAHERTIRLCERFYFLTLLRDARFVENALSRMERGGENVAVLVTGGYHTPNLKRLLRRRKVAYACVTPHVLAETNHERYEKLLLGQKAAFFGGRKPSVRRSTMMLPRTFTYDPWGNRQELARELAGDAWPRALAELDARRRTETPQAAAGARVARFEGFPHLLHLVVRSKIEEMQEEDVPATDPRLAELFAVDRALVEPYENNLKARLDSHEAIRVLQYNQMGNPTRERLERITRDAASVSPAAPPTLITLQETSQRLGEYNTAVELANAMGYKHQEYLYRDHPAEGFQEGMAIVYHPSYEQVGMRHLSVPGRGGIPVLILGVTLRSSITGKRVHVFTTRLSWHLDADAERVAQLRRMRDFIRGGVPENEPVIFSGDFNYAAESEARTASKALGEGFVDAFRQTNDNLRGVTTSREVRTVKFPGKRPDLVYAAGLTPVHSRTVLNQAPSSDHFGVIADFDWTGENPPVLEPNRVLRFAAEKDRTHLLRRFSQAVAAGEISEDLFGRAMAALAVADPDLAGHCLEMVRSLPGHPDVVRHFQMSRDGAQVTLPEDRDEKVRFILRLLEPERFQRVNARIQDELLDAADGIELYDEEFDRYEDLLVRNLKRAENPRIRELLFKYARDYVGTINAIPDNTLVVIQAAGKSTRLQSPGRAGERRAHRDKNSEPIGGLSQIRRHLNVLAALGYKHVAIVHNDLNGRDIRSEVALGNYGESLQVEYVDGTDKEWFQNFAETVRAAEGRYENVMMLIGESPVSVDNVARMRFTDRRNNFVFYPAEGSFHRADITPKGRIRSYRTSPGEGDLALVSFSAPVQDLLAHWNDAEGKQLPDRSIETFLQSVHADPLSAAIVLPEPADNLNTPADLEALRGKYFHSVHALGTISADRKAPVHPRRLVRAALILAGIPYGDSELHPQSHLPVFSHRSTVIGTKDGKYYVKIQLLDGPNYKREVWFYGTPHGVKKPDLVWNDDAIGAIVTTNVGAGASMNLLEWVKSNDLLSAQITSPNREAMVLGYVRDMMDLLYNFQKSDRNLGALTLRDDAATASRLTLDLSSLGYNNVGSWLPALRAIERYAEKAAPNPVLSHGDFGPPNVIVLAPGSAALVDGEYAGLLAPKERDLGTALARMIQISINNENLAAQLDAMLARYEALVGRPVDKPLLYYFIARKFLDSAHDIVYYRTDQIGGRRDVEMARQFLELMEGAVPRDVFDQTPVLAPKDADVPGEEESVRFKKETSDIMGVVRRVQIYTRLLDHLRFDRINVAGDADVEGKRSAVAYYLQGDDQTRVTVRKALQVLSLDREPKVAANAKKTIALIEQSGARLAQETPPAAGLLGLQPAPDDQALSFAEGVYGSTRKTGAIALSASMLETLIDASGTLVIRKDGRELARREARSVARSAAGARLSSAESVSGAMTVSDVKMKLDEARARTDGFETDPVADAVRASVVVDLDGLNPSERGFEETIVPFLARELRAAREGTPWGRNAKFLLAGDPAAVERVMAEMAALYPSGQDFVTDDPAALGENAARSIRLTSPSGKRTEGARHFYVETPSRGDIPDFRGSFKAALSIARLEALDATDPGFGRVKGFVETLLRRPVEAADFISAVEARLPRERLSEFAVPPIVRLPINLILQGARLAIRMAEQSA